MADEVFGVRLIRRNRILASLVVSPSSFGRVQVNRRRARKGMKVEGRVEMGEGKKVCSIYLLFALPS